MAVFPVDRSHIIPRNAEFIIHELNVSENLKGLYFNPVDGIEVEDVFSK
ncbi:MAG: hypothetical protein ACE5GH_01870 [Fidelibacterota bacterium]